MTERMFLLHQSESEQKRNPLQKKHRSLFMKEIWPKIHSLDSLLKKQILSPDHLYRWSQFVIPYNAGESCFLYNTLTRQCVSRSISEHTSFTDRHFCNFASSAAESKTRSYEELNKDPELLQLMQDYYLVPADRDEAAFYLELYKAQRMLFSRPGISGYTILPTWSCNARCCYCFEEGLPRTSMSEDTVEKTISFMLSNKRKGKPLHLKWFGGEPLLSVPVIDRISQALEKDGVSFSAVMTTNGSLITDDILARMKGLWHLKSAKVSMDCAEETYIRRKNYIHYDNTYWKVMENVNRMMEAGILVTIRCNADEGNMDEIPAFLTDLSRMIRKKENLTVGFSPLHASARNSTCLPLLDRLRQALTEAEAYGFAADRARETTGFSINHCMADHPQGHLVIAPTGDLYLCSFCEPGTSVGNVREGITRRDIYNEYMEPGPVREKCEKCPFLPHCTPFSRCPVTRYYCRENQMHFLEEKLLKEVTK